MRLLVLGLLVDEVMGRFDLEDQIKFMDFERFTHVPAKEMGFSTVWIKR